MNRLTAEENAQWSISLDQRELRMLFIANDLSLTAAEVLYGRTGTLFE
jgi:hypothetical protein